MKTCSISVFLLFLPLWTNESPLPPSISVHFIASVSETNPIYVNGNVVRYTATRCVGDARVIQEMYPIVRALIDSAHSVGVPLKINSGYRTYEEQVSYRIKALKPRYKGGIDTLIYHGIPRHFHPPTAKPGYSEHQAGIAFDFNTRNKAVYNWLKKHAFKYGFVRTVHSEPWHWEYRPEITDQYCYVSRNHKSWR
jgi:LAS superfamily LD-carboxypeptidase LdcB